MANVQHATIELWMHLGGLLSTQEARVAKWSFISLQQFCLSSNPSSRVARWKTWDKVGGAMGIP